MTTPADVPLPASARLAWWATSWLRGHVVTDLLLDAVIGPDATHVVSGLAELGLGGDGSTESLVPGLARLRAEGATGLGAAFPTEGDPVGLGGPLSFNDAALDVGEAVVVLDAGIGLVPRRVGAAVTWVAYPADRRQLPDVGEADRALRAALLETADALAALDVARWRPEVADRLLNLRHRNPLSGPAGIPPRCIELAARGLQAIEIVELAFEDVGGAVSAWEVEQRWAALRPLDRAGRRALVAATSPEAWPPA